MMKSEKPIKEILFLIEKLCLYESYTLLPIYQKENAITITCKNESLCFLLLSGGASISRSDDLIIGRIESPMIIGLSTLYNFPSNYKVLPDLNAKFMLLPSDDVRACISEQNAWECVSVILSYNIYMLNYRDTISFGKDAYTLIKYAISAYLKLPIEIKNKETFPNFIIKRTLLSRSIVMRILRKLKKGGYIEVVKGRLINVDKLPDNF